MRSPILRRDARWKVAHGDSRQDAMLRNRIKPYNEQQAEQVKRAEQQRVYRRNEVFGLMILAAAICAWWLWHTNPGWIFPAGWWRP